MPLGTSLGLGALFRKEEERERDRGSEGQKLQQQRTSNNARRWPELPAVGFDARRLGCGGGALSIIFLNK